jgi:tRNA (guanine10-N2)-methyltransferase
MPGHLVMDPYAGTGSILIAAAEFGAQVLGADIDMRVIKHGKTDKATGAHTDLYSNFGQYKLGGRLGGLLRLDMHTAPLRPGLEEVRQ